MDVTRRAAHSRYWMLRSDGKVYPFGDAGAYNRNVHSGSKVDLEPTPSFNGYWVLNSNGSVDWAGDARYLSGSTLALAPSPR